MISESQKIKLAVGAFSIALILSVSVSPAQAARDTNSGLKTGKQEKVTDEALAEQMKMFATAIKGAIAGLNTKYQASGETEKAIASLPARDKVIENKDVQHFREYSGLSEIYLFNNKTKEAEELRSWVVANSAKVLGKDDPYPAVIDSDFGLYYYDRGELEKAEGLLKGSMARLESQMVTKPDEVRNNLISVYAGLAEISFSRGNKVEARRYVDKISKIAPAQ